MTLGGVLSIKRVVLARELTKKFEEFIRGSLQQVIEQMQNREILGEFVVMLSSSEEK